MRRKMGDNDIQVRVSGIIKGLADPCREAPEDVKKAFYSALEGLPGTGTASGFSWSFVLVPAIAAILICAAVYFFLQPKKPVVTNFSGTVKVFRGDGNSGEFVTKDLKLNKGDVVKTFGDGSADIISGEYHLRLKASTEVRLDALSGSITDSPVEYTLKAGDILAYYKKVIGNVKEFHIETALAAVSVLGTDFMVGLSPGTGDTWVGVMNGLVKVTGKDIARGATGQNDILLKPGEKTVVGKGKAPGTPEKMLGEELMSMSELYGLGKKTKVALIISSGEGRTRELLASTSLYITDKADSKLSREMKGIVADLNKALKERSKEKYMENIDKFEKLIMRAPNPEYEFQFLLFIGAYYSHISDYEGAIRTFRKGIDKYPGSSLVSIARCAIGLIYEEKMARRDEAIAEYKSILEQYPGSPEAYEASNGLERLKE
ncbi:MAG: tetratricopeptide repeat protein [Candidatus Omnitrophica bacterium]|nr:tetratricopeptide repeat protein [Candidatus Omnitrophota bacterium]